MGLNRHERRRSMVARRQITKAAVRRARKKFGGGVEMLNIDNPMARISLACRVAGEPDDMVTDSERERGLIPGAHLPDGGVVTSFRDERGYRLVSRPCATCGKMGIHRESNGKLYCEEHFCSVV